MAMGVIDMLEIKNLCKTYKTKGGVITKALDDVSLVFPEKGLVFLLGKSGSGKSTLLNMIGGLDRPDSGEIIVKGRSSKNFSQADFDSYRNTYIGFIFQEYNVLNEFNIEQNISLALQLQGKKNDKEAVNALLAEVNLEGFNKRKPNTLSGGQKQRIAIARALIKSPEIIMADEPTGALDSVTGKQVLETLKKLSKDKLVIIVSHDRDFAEEYGDRIIELKDGKILSDKSKELVPPKVMNDNVTIINGNLIDIKNGAALTESDFRTIYETIKQSNQGVLISTGEENVTVAKKAQRISESGHGEVFAPTQSVETKTYDPKETTFIRSHLPFSRSFKMGASGLKTKPVRLIFTILLSVVSFTLFGVATTLMFYNPSYSLAQAMAGSERKSEAIVKKYKYYYTYKTIDNRTGEIISESDSTYESTDDTLFGVSELASLQEQRPNKFAGVFSLTSYFSSPVNMSFNGISVNDASRDFYSVNGFLGLSDVEPSYFEQNNFTLQGTHPSNETDIAISNYHYELIKQSGFFDKGGDTIEHQDDLIGKKLPVMIPNKNGGSQSVEFTITGIYDFGPVSSKYDSLKAEKDAATSSLDRSKLLEQYRDYLCGSFYTLGYVSPSFYDSYGFVPQSNNYYLPSVSLKGIQFYDSYSWAEMDNVDYDRYSSVVLKEQYDEMPNRQYYDADFNPVSNIELNDDEVLLSYRNAYGSYFYRTMILPIEQVIETVTRQTDYFDEHEKAFFDDFYERYNWDTSSTRTEEGAALKRLILAQSDSSMRNTAKVQEDVELLSSYMDGLFDKYVELSYYGGLVNAIRNVYYARYGEDISVNATAQGLIEDIEDNRSHLEDGYTEAMQQNMEAKHTQLLNVLDAVDQERAEVAAMAQSFYESIHSNYQNIIWEQLGRYYPEIVNEFTWTLEQSIDDFKSSFSSLYHAVYTDAGVLEYTFNPHFIQDYQVYVEEEKGSTGKYYSKDYSGRIKEYTVKGYYDSPYDGYAIVTRSAVRDFFEQEQSGISGSKTEYVAPEDAKYSFLICPTDYSESDIAFLTANYKTYRYEMTNSIYQTASYMTNMVTTLNTVFLIVAGVTGALAALMLLNFISVSIANKNKDIGILRAVGARGSDVFKIFLSESALIAAICFVLAVIAAGLTCFYLNQMFIDSFLGISLLKFGFLNILMMAGVELIITLIATLIPVSIASRKPPVEAIRSL